MIKGKEFLSIAQLLVQKREYGKRFVDRDEFCIKPKAFFYLMTIKN